MRRTTAVIVAALVGCFLACAGVPDASKPSTESGFSKQGARDAVRPSNIGEPFRIGSHQITVTSASLGRARLRTSSGTEYDYPEIDLVLKIKVENLSTTKKLDYHRWRLSFLGDTQATDEHGNVYRMQYHDDIRGGNGFATMHPGDSPVEDIIFFQRPVTVAAKVIVRLAARGDETGQYLFEIPNPHGRK